jgi:hypothetical protein
MRTILSLITILYFSLQLNAQQGYYQSQDLNVIKNGVDLINPWAGGVNVPQLSPIDLNNDGILDLVIFDKNGDQINCYLNNGTEGVVDYHYAPEYNLNFPDLEDWVLLRDYNCDSKMDIFTSHNGGIRLYENTSSGNDLSFNLMGTILTDRGSGPTNLYVSSVDIPHIGDLDYDGDLDILTFTIIGSHVEWHKNTSIENYGTCDSLSYELADDCWGDFSENFSDNSVTLNDCDVLKTGSNLQSSKHSGSTVTALDLTGDSYFELLLGDVTFDNLVMLENSADTENALMISQDIGFPSNTISVDIPKFPAAYHFDFDNDNRKDLIVSPNGNNVSDNYQNIWFYKNESTTETSELNLIQKNILLDQMIEVGSGAHPILFDYNNDGLQDLIVANYGYYIEGGNFNSQLALYKNIGTLNNPEYEWVTDDYANLGTLNFENNISPTFGDLDNDGDLDMLVGDSDGKLHLLNNIFMSGESNFFINTVDYFDIDVGSFASPFLVDIDRDDDLDLIIGTRHGNIYHYENQGSINDAEFILVNDLFGDINLTDPIYNTAYTTPMVIDGEDGFELYVGTERGNIHHYTNIDDNLEGLFTEVNDSLLIYSNGIRTAPYIYDLNNDGWNDMLLGVYTGGVHLLWGCDYNQVSTPEKENVLFKIYPNPTKGILHLENFDSISQVNVYSLGGRLCYSATPKRIIDLSHLESGLYFIQSITTNGSLQTMKICIQ